MGKATKKSRPHKGTGLKISRYHPICPHEGDLSKAGNGWPTDQSYRDSAYHYLALSFGLGAPGRVLEGPLASASQRRPTLWGPVPPVLLPFIAFLELSLHYFQWNEISKVQARLSIIYAALHYINK